MIYITGDIHGSPWRIIKHATKFKLTAEDIIIILGDVGANYYRDERDTLVKKHLNRLAPTILCIHGNHEIRPGTISSYKQKNWNGGRVYYEKEYPKLLFAVDGEIFNLDGNRCIAIGGAYSVDKFYRICKGYGWWEDEQPSEEIKAYVEKQLELNSVDIVLSHTCPLKYEPIEVFLPQIDQSTVDKSTEAWLDSIEDNLVYKAWYCGHYHTTKRIDNMHFLFESWECLELKEEV